MTGQAADQPGETWDEPSRSLLREVWRDFSRAKKLPSDFVVKLSRECSLAQQVWADAKEQNKFVMFLPNLRTVIQLKREEAEYLEYHDSPYNALLDVYEPGSTIAGLQPVFAALKARLVPLLKRITQSRVQIDDGLLRHSNDQARQLEFGRLVLIAMGCPLILFALKLKEPAAGQMGKIGSLILKEISPLAFTANLS